MAFASNGCVRLSGPISSSFLLLKCLGLKIFKPSSSILQYWITEFSNLLSERKCSAAMWIQEKNSILCSYCPQFYEFSVYGWGFRVHSQQHAQIKVQSQYRYLSTQVIWTKLRLKNSQSRLLMLNTQRICFHQWKSNSYCVVTCCSLRSIGNKSDLVLQTMDECFLIRFGFNMKNPDKRWEHHWLKITR